jgi:predicted nucleic acid-binding protein
MLHACRIFKFVRCRFRSTKHWSEKRSSLDNRFNSSLRRSWRTLPRPLHLRNCSTESSKQASGISRPKVPFRRSQVNVLIVDASVLAPVITDGGEDGKRLRARLRGENLVGPDLLSIEVASVLRSQTLPGLLTKSQADQAINDLAGLPISIIATRPLLRRAWELAPNVTPSDAYYVALAEVLDALLLTANRRLAGAKGPRCTFELVAP